MTMYTKDIKKRKKTFVNNIFQEGSFYLVLVCFYVQGEKPSRETVLNNFVCDTEKISTTYISLSKSSEYLSWLCWSNMSTWNETMLYIGYTEEDINNIYEMVSPAVCLFVS